MILRKAIQLGESMLQQCMEMEKNPGMEDILAVAGAIGMDMRKARQTAKEIRECVETELKEYIKV